MSTCSTCQFFKADESVCRRYPPMAMMYPDRGPPKLEGGNLVAGNVGIKLGSTFAPTTPDEWCGEWRETADSAAMARQLGTHRTMEN